ncbi:hypothetical protein C8R45DRAFT_934767 [Mycena sanguinolenta]|nr:hypothetical protein C8R45DRAFT_934767 [Mycena sanguinolenta]
MREEPVFMKLRVSGRFAEPSSPSISKLESRAGKERLAKGLVADHGHELWGIWAWRLAGVMVRRRSDERPIADGRAASSFGCGLVIRTSCPALKFSHTTNDERAASTSLARLPTSTPSKPPTTWPVEVLPQWEFDSSLERCTLQQDSLQTCLCGMPISVHLTIKTRFKPASAACQFLRLQCASLTAAKSAVFANRHESLTAAQSAALSGKTSFNPASAAACQFLRASISPWTAAHEFYS